MVEPDSTISRPGTTILVTTDLTDLHQLCREVSLQASEQSVKVWLLHVIPPVSYVFDETGERSVSSKDLAFQDAQRLLAKTSQQLRKKKVICEYEVRRSTIVDGIASFVQQKQIDRVIQGTSAKGRFGRFFLGSIAESLIHTLEIPVCTLGPNYGRAPQDGLCPILVATSLKSGIDAQAQLKLAARLSQQDNQQEIALLHVISADQENTTESCAEQAIAQMSALATQLDVRCHIFVRFGNPVDELMREMSELSPKAIVLGARDLRQNAISMRSGRVHQLIAYARCPVFTLREQAKRKIYHRP